ncbi:hypothetical protein M8J76_009605 [Diaphorina citri]|nr:hypothetical protein M8J76_009605 [Diaphorina citri]
MHLNEGMGSLLIDYAVFVLLLVSSIGLSIFFILSGPKEKTKNSCVDTGHILIILCRFFVVLQGMGSLLIDYAVFVLLLVSSIGVSIWSKLSGPKEKTKNSCGMGSLLIDYAVFVLLLVSSIGVSIWSKLSGPKEKTKNSCVDTGHILIILCRFFVVLQGMGSLLIDYAVFVLLLVSSIGVSIWSKLSGPKEKTKNSCGMGSLLIDYAVFVLLLVSSIGVSIWSKLSGPKEKTKNDYVFAQNNVSMGAMILSIARGFLGVRVFLGYPSELYYRGSEMWETLYGMVIAFPIVLYFFVPVYFNLGVTSVYQYLDMRFKSRLVRRLASGTYLFRSLLNLGVTVFTPCVALKTVIGFPYSVSIISITFIATMFTIMTVIGFPYSVSIISITFIATMFTIMGGLRSAITADVVQCIVMLGCSCIMILQGMYEAEGPLKIFKINRRRGRLDFFNWDLDPTVRVTTTSALIGQLFMSVSLYGCQQNFVQRYCSMGSFKRISQTLWGNVPVMTILFSLNWVVGMVIFALYADCDPKRIGYISDNDEILPFYVEDKFYFLPGFLGLVMASLFNGALSLLVSNLNSMGSVLWEDFISQIPAMKSLPDSSQLMVIKLCGVICGVIIMGIAFVVAHLSGVIEASQLMTSATTGPLLGVFILAMFFPSANWKGAVAGMIVSHVVIIWITIGGLLVDKPPIDYLPTSTDACTNTTFGPHISPFHQSALLALFNDSETLIDDFEEASSVPDVRLANFENEGGLNYLYRITYMYYAMIAYLSDEEHEYNEKLIHPLALKLSKLWSGGNKQCYATDDGTPHMLNTISTISESVNARYKEKAPV